MNADMRDWNKLLAALSPNERKKLTRKLAMVQRRNAISRIKKNIDPDGNKFEKRKPQKYNVKKGKMMKKIGQARRMKIRATPNFATVTYKNGLDAYIAGVHQEGEEVKVNKHTKVKYPKRALYGFAKDDDKVLAKEVQKHLGF